MTDPRLEDHVVGLELQLVELVERRERALAQGRIDDAATIAAEIEEVQTELMVCADAVANNKPSAEPEVLAESAEEALFSLLDGKPPRRRRARIAAARQAHA